jgi:hypothetical protein
VLALEPDISVIHGESDDGEKNHSQANYDENHRLAALVVDTHPASTAANESEFLHLIHLLIDNAPLRSGGYGGCTAEY